jgi:hypothetical protein
MGSDRRVWPDDGLNFAVTLPLRALPRFPAVELLAAVNGLIWSAGAAAQLVPDLTVFDDDDTTGRFWHRPKAPPRIGLTLNGVTLSIQGYDRPGFRIAELEALDDRDWPDGREKVARARAHLKITEVGPANGFDFDQNYDRAAVMTVVAQAAAKLAQAVGIVWHSSRRAMPVERLEPMVTALVDEQPPVSLWLGCSTRRSAGRMLTRGLYPLLGAEVEVASAALTEEAAREVALALAADILDSGRVPAENETIDYDRQTVLHIGYRQGGDTTVPAIVLTQIPRQSDLEPAAGAA